MSAKGSNSPPAIRGRVQLLTPHTTLYDTHTVLPPTTRNTPSTLTVVLPTAETLAPAPTPRTKGIQDKTGTIHNRNTAHTPTTILHAQATKGRVGPHIVGNPTTPITQTAQTTLGPNRMGVTTHGPRRTQHGNTSHASVTETVDPNLGNPRGSSPELRPACLPWHCRNLYLARDSALWPTGPGTF